MTSLVDLAKAKPSFNKEPSDKRVILLSCGKYVRLKVGAAASQGLGEVFGVITALRRFECLPGPDDGHDGPRFGFWSILEFKARTRSLEQRLCNKEP